MVAGDGLIQLSQVLERIAKDVMRLSIIGLDGDSLMVGGNGLIHSPQFLEHGSKIAMCLGDIRLYIKNLSVDYLRLLQLSGLMQLKAFLSKLQKFIDRDATPSLFRGLRRMAAFFFKGLPS